MANTDIRIEIRSARPAMFPVARALRPLWRAMPERVRYPVLFALLGAQWSFDNGKTWKRIRVARKQAGELA